MKVNKNKVGVRIQQIRRNKGMTLEEFGKLFGASRGNVSLWEKGYSLPNNKRLKSIADLANITVDELLHGKEKEQITMATEIYKGKVKVVDEKIGDVMLEIETGDYGFMDLLEELKNDALFEHYDSSGLYILKEVKFIRKAENKVINRFYFKGAN